MAAAAITAASSAERAIATFRLVGVNINPSISKATLIVPPVTELIFRM